MLTIRQCEESDLPALHTLYRQLHNGKTDATLEEIIAGFQAMRAFPGCEVYVADIDAQVVGTFVLYLLPNMTRHGRPAAILENIVVDEGQRGRGIGRAMLEFAHGRARKEGCYKLSLTSNAARTEAHEFYRRCGMTQHGVSFRFSF
jgi:GNAT superfamily N-acetyltransferase